MMGQEPGELGAQLVVRALVDISFAETTRGFASLPSSRRRACVVSYATVARQNPPWIITTSAACLPRGSSTSITWSGPDPQGRGRSGCGGECNSSDGGFRGCATSARASTPRTKLDPAKHLEARLEELVATPPLPERPDLARANAWPVGAYQKVWSESALDLASTG
ncbi:hypothetical protein AB0L88_07935 [Saccharopolyspora shandongensis]|uniref:hypothetical protein n=1 Tax=Saccharopolyspora shandongensis TaxID=418495 RepID=UPI00341BF23A